MAKDHLMDFNDVLAGLMRSPARDAPIPIREVVVPEKRAIIPGFLRRSIASPPRFPVPKKRVLKIEDLRPMQPPPKKKEVVKIIDIIEKESPKEIPKLQVLTGWDPIDPGETKDYHIIWSELLRGPDGSVDSIGESGTFCNNTTVIEKAVPKGGNSMQLIGGNSDGYIQMGDLFRVEGVEGLFRFTSAAAAKGETISHVEFAPKSPGFPGKAAIISRPAIFAPMKETIDAGIQVQGDSSYGDNSQAWISISADGAARDDLLINSPYLLEVGISTTAGRVYKRTVALEVRKL